jgi:regulator of PEP synthase PpsR (kinase-PPPase family)
VQYGQVRAIEHHHPLVRSQRELTRVLKDIEASPGIVLYTIFNKELAEELEQSCKALKIPCVPALQKILQVFESYLGTPSTPTVGGQHVLDADYFARIEALNFTMAHDDGHLPENLDDADIILVGISRTSKTPT